MKHRHRSTKSLVIALLVVLAGLAIAAPPATAGASKPFAFTPLTVTRANSSTVVYVVGSVKCSNVLCLRLLRTSDNGAHFETVSLPPIPANPVSSTGMLDELVFANANDGYALVGGGYAAEGYNPPSLIYATFNGARTWHKENIANGVGIFAFEASANEVYAVTAHCVGTKLPCQNYRLNRSALSAKKWTSGPIPGYSAGLELGLFGAYGSYVWLDVTQLGRVDTSHNDGKTFTVSLHRNFGSPGTCDLTATSESTLWARCPTGMMADFFYSRDGGVRWSTIPTGLYSNTGGGTFDPVSNTLAYLNYGQSVATPGLYRITGAGRHLVDVGKLPCASVESFLFSDEAHGLALCLKSAAASSAHLVQTSNGGASWHRVLAP